MKDVTAISKNIFNLARYEPWVYLNESDKVHIAHSLAQRDAVLDVLIKSTKGDLINSRILTD